MPVMIRGWQEVFIDHMLESFYLLRVSCVQLDLCLSRTSAVSAFAFLGLPERRQPWRLMILMCISEEDNEHQATIVMKSGSPIAL